MVACSGSPLFTHMFMLANSHGDSRALLCSESLTKLTSGMQPCSKAGICWKAFLPTDMFRSQLSPDSFQTVQEPGRKTQLLVGLPLEVQEAWI